MSFWHTKEEKPERFRDIICKLLQHKYNGRIVYRNTGDNVDFYLTGVERWAYPEDFDKAAEENQQLKELLRECQSVLANYKDLCGNFPAKNIVADRVLTKIDNAIGEKK